MTNKLLDFHTASVSTGCREKHCTDFDRLNVFFHSLRQTKRDAFSKTLQRKKAYLKSLKLFFCVVSLLDLIYNKNCNKNL